VADNDALNGSEADADQSPGDAAAVTKLLDAHRAGTLEYICRHFPKELAGMIDPADVLQDTLFEAWRSLATFRDTGQDSFPRLLVTIARHQLIDCLRSYNSLRRGGSGALPAEGDQHLLQPVSRLLEELAVHCRTPSRSAATREFLEAVNRSIGDLPEDQGCAVRFRHVDQLTIAEVACKMGKTEDAVHQLCNRGLRGLRKALGSRSLFL